MLDLPQVVLEITRGRAKYRCREVASRVFLIGSAPDCDLVLGDSRFDPVHSYVFLEPRRVTVRQLGSGPALCVDGRSTPSAELADGHTLQMGPYEFHVRIEWPTAGQNEEPTGDAAQDTVLLDDVDRATERLLADVEQHSDAPRLSLFVGDEESEPERRPLPPTPADPAHWRPSQASAVF